MNILLIDHYAGSPSMGMEYRPYYMAREWEIKGHNVLIVTSSNAHVRSKQFHIKGKYESQKIDGINYLIIKTPAYKKNNLKRILNIISFISRLYKKVNYIVQEFEPHVVIASSTYPLDIYPANKMAKLCGAKLIFEVHDLWPLSPMQIGGYSKHHPYIICMQKAENYAYKNADAVVSIIPNALDYMVEHGLSIERYFHIPNGTCVDEWDITKNIPNELSNIIQDLKKQDKILVGYLGSHGLANDLFSVLDAMKLLEQYNISLLLIGEGSEKKNLVKYASRLRMINVYFFPPVIKAVVPSLLNKLDILYIGLQSIPLLQYGVSPNKLIDYLMSGKPIVQAIKAGNDIVREVGCGISVGSGDTHAIATAILELSSLSPEELFEMGNKGKQYCILNHDYKNLAKKMLELFNYTMNYKTEIN